MSKFLSRVRASDDVGVTEHCIDNKFTLVRSTLHQVHGNMYVFAEYR